MAARGPEGLTSVHSHDLTTPGKPGVMADFMDQLGWARGPGIWVNRDSGCVRESISGWDEHVSRWTEDGGDPPQRGAGQSTGDPNREQNAARVPV